MSDIFIVTMGAANEASRIQFAFYNQKEAEKFRDHIDRNKGAGSHHSTVHLMRIYDSASQLIKKE